MDEFQFDKALLHPTRLALVAYLARHGGEAPFAKAWPALGIQHAGTFSVHSRVLEDAGYIRIEKSVVARRLRTSLVLTDKGRLALVALNALPGAVPIQEAVA
jgi:DNA-binding transcriptional ArsR family regulator